MLEVIFMKLTYAFFLSTVALLISCATVEKNKSLTSSDLKNSAQQRNLASPLDPPKDQRPLTTLTDINKFCSAIKNLNRKSRKRERKRDRDINFESLTQIEEELDEYKKNLENLNYRETLPNAEELLPRYEEILQNYQEILADKKDPFERDKRLYQEISNAREHPNIAVYFKKSHSHPCGKELRWSPHADERTFARVDRTIARHEQFLTEYRELLTQYHNDPESIEKVPRYEVHVSISAPANRHIFANVYLHGYGPTHRLYRLTARQNNFRDTITVTDKRYKNLRVSVYDRDILDVDNMGWCGINDIHEIEEGQSETHNNCRRRRIGEDVYVNIFIRRLP